MCDRVTAGDKAPCGPIGPSAVVPAPFLPVGLSLMITRRSFSLGTHTIGVLAMGHGGKGDERVPVLVTLMVLGMF